MNRLRFVFGCDMVLKDFNGNPDFEGAYSATGYGGQFITIIPKLEMVIAHKTTLNLFNFIGLRHDVSNNQYWKIVDTIINAKD